jgi:hypothetical protein
MIDRNIQISPGFTIEGLIESNTQGNGFSTPCQVHFQLFSKEKGGFEAIQCESGQTLSESATRRSKGIENFL